VEQFFNVNVCRREKGLKSRPAKIIARENLCVDRRELSYFSLRYLGGALWIWFMSCAAYIS